MNILEPIAGAVQVYCQENRVKVFPADGVTIEVQIKFDDRGIGGMRAKVVDVDWGTPRPRKVTGRKVPRKRPAMACAPNQRWELAAAPMTRTAEPAEAVAAHGRIGRQILEWADPPMGRVDSRDCQVCGRVVNRVPLNVVNVRCGLHPDIDLRLEMDDDEEVPMGSGIPDPRLASVGRQRREQVMDPTAPIIPGATVFAKDQENYGTVVAVGSGSAVVNFRNNERGTAEDVELPLYLLVVVR